MIDTLKKPETSRVTAPMAAPATGSAEARVEAVLATFAKVETEGLPASLKKIQDDARLRASELGFPTTRLEEFRFTNMAAILQLPLHPAEKTKVTAAQIAPFLYDLDCYRLVFVDGHFAADLSLLPADGNDLKVANLAACWKNNCPEVEKHLTRHADPNANFFTALNTGFFQDGPFIYIPSGKVADKPVHLLFVGASEKPGATASLRTLVVAPANAQVKIVETHVSLKDAARVTNIITELVLGDHAQVEHCKVQQDSDRAFHVSTIQAEQGRESRWVSHSIATGARLSRNQVQTRFGGERGEAVLNGLYLGHGEQLVDHHTVVDHAMPRCESHEFYHGILADRSHGVFNGKIFVRKDAQKTNAKQTNRNLLLSDNAMIDTKPQLEILADDVKCTHGATVGQLNEEAIFYLRARGIGAERARRMLIQAFAADVVERIGIEPVRARLEAMLEARFDAAAS